MDWYRNLWIVLSVEDKLPYLEQPIPAMPVPPTGQVIPPDVLNTHTAWVKASKEIIGLMLMTMDPEIQKTLEHLGAFDMLKELKTFYIDNLERLGHSMTQNLSVSLILVSLRKEYDGFVQKYNMHSMGKTMTELHAMLKLHEQTLPPKEVAPALHAIRAGRIQKNQKKKSHKAAKGNQGKGKAKMGYAPVQVPPFAPKPKNPPTPKKDNLAKDAICHQCGKDDIYEIDLSSSNTNDSSMYAVRNKRAKLNLDSALLWHYHLGHISKKRIKKLQHDGLLDSTDIKSFKKYVSCMSGKMARKPYSHQVERAKDLLGLIRTDEVEYQLGKTIKSLCSNHKGEYISQEFLDHLRDHGIIAHRTPPYMPQHNGVSGRRYRTFLDMVRSMMSQTTLPKSFRDYALESAACILNMVPTKKVDKTPYKVWHGQALKLSYLKVWGCEALAKRDTITKPDKLEPRSIKCIFVGYPKETTGYSFYYPPKNKVFVARNAEFLENSLIDQEANDDQEIDEPQSDINTIHRSIRTRRPTDRLFLYVDAEKHELEDLGEPANYKAALLDPESDKRINAKNVEMQSMKDNEVWELVDLPPNGKTVNIRAIRILIAIAVFYDYEIWKMDVKTAFLNGYLNEEILHGNSKRGMIPMQEKLKFSKSQGASTPAEKQRMQNIPYASAVGSIMYAVRCTRTDVVFAQNITSRFQQNPGEVHWTTVKNILKYLRNTKDMFLVYGDADDMKSQTGYVFILNRGVVDWKSTKQIKEPISMYCDNTRAITIAKDHGVTKGARHFRAKVHYLRETIEMGDVKIEVDTNDNLADPFTKALAFPKHAELT
ncbi:retrotransposon protein, putative, ty1-copia subclass [Tanacetum coccineum]|uniref:Retrotransposon protein, putative, ty1-copia subclass n=1 Tax=Tanacetum coccineum TaxID=301880 RepID=A0ABQ4ZKY8_9ASTR